MVEKASKLEGTSGRQNVDEFEPKKQTSKEKISDKQLDSEKHDKEGLSLSCSSKQQQQQQLVPKQQQKCGRTEPKQEKPGMFYFVSVALYLFYFDDLKWRCD